MGDEEQYIAIGEVTPSYFSAELCAERIAKLKSIRRLILLLRHPVERLYSEFLYAQRINGYSDSFEKYYVEVERSIQRGMYGKHYARFNTLFPKSDICVLIYDDMFKNIKATLTKVAVFLNVPPEGFSRDVANLRVNAMPRPRRKKFYEMASMTHRWLVRHDVDRVSYYFKRAGIKKWFGISGDPIPSIGSQTASKLQVLYLPDIERLEAVRGLDLSAWKTRY